jgi:hypothetical protein
MYPHGRSRPTPRAVKPAHIAVSGEWAERSVAMDHLHEQCCVAITHVVREWEASHIPLVSNVALQQTKGPVP